MISYSYRFRQFTWWSWNVSQREVWRASSLCYHPMARRANLWRWSLSSAVDKQYLQTVSVPVQELAIFNHLTAKFIFEIANSRLRLGQIHELATVEKWMDTAALDWEKIQCRIRFSIKYTLKTLMGTTMDMFSKTWKMQKLSNNWNDVAHFLQWISQRNSRKRQEPANYLLWSNTCLSTAIRCRWSLVHLRRQESFMFADFSKESKLQE